MGSPPLGAAMRATAYGLPLDELTGSQNPPLWGCLPLESLLCCWDYPLSEPPMFARSADEITPIQRRKTSAFRLSSFDSQADEPLIVSLYQCRSADGIIPY